LDEARAAHAVACAECRAASAKAIADVDFAAAALTADSGDESADAKAASLTRLRVAMASDVRPHVHIEDLLLHLDGESVPAVSAHLEGCGDCHDELLRAQTLLCEVEHELRALIPDETTDQRLASAARLEQALDARRSRVLSFPAPWRAVYAAAALVAAGLFSFAWQARQPLELELAISAPAAPAVGAVTPVEAESPAGAPSRPASSRPVPSQPEPSRPEPLMLAEATAPQRLLPVRFNALPAPSASRPRPAAIEPQVAPTVAFVAEPVLTAGSELPSLLRPAAESPTALFERARVAEPTRLALSNHPVGGLVRTALIEHYGDAARRSFRAVRPNLLEGELARYVSEVLHADSELLRHAYALHEMLERSEVETLSPADLRELRAEARRRLSAIRSNEERLYTKLSEALPRRYWAAKGARDGNPSEADLSGDARTLLDAALKLDKSLSAIFVSSDSAVRLEVDPASLGDLLYVVRSSSRNLQQRLSVLR
jgi:hypothetical protein